MLLRTLYYHELILLLPNYWFTLHRVALAGLFFSLHSRVMKPDPWYGGIIHHRGGKNHSVRVMRTEKFRRLQTNGLRLFSTQDLLTTSVDRGNLEIWKCGNVEIFSTTDD